MEGDDDGDGDDGHVDGEPEPGEEGPLVGEVVARCGGGVGEEEGDEWGCFGGAVRERLVRSGKRIGEGGGTDCEIWEAYLSIGRGYFVKGETSSEMKSRTWDIVKSPCTECHRSCSRRSLRIYGVRLRDES